MSKPNNAPVVQYFDDDFDDNMFFEEFIDRATEEENADYNRILIDITDEDGEFLDFQDEGFGDDIAVISNAYPLTSPKKSIVGNLFTRLRVSRLLSLFRGDIYPRMLDRPLPSEPVGISVMERRSAWCEKLDHGELLRKIRDTKNPIMCIFGVFFLSTLWPMILIKTDFIPGRPSNEYIAQAFAIVFSLMGTGMCLSFLTEYRRIINTRNLMDTLRWKTRYLDALSLADNMNCVVSTEIHVIRQILNGYPKDFFPELPSADVIGLVSLAESIRKTVSNHKGAIRIEVCGEQSELLGRVAEALTGQSVKSQIEKFNNPVTVRLPSYQ